MIDDCLFVIYLFIDGSEVPLNVPPKQKNVYIETGLLKPRIVPVGFLD
jgi:hypothetical protein